ncbi:MAG: hypothetical protein FJ040_03220 [Chloroflexi bacterium]|nr:hypothetical protein [Chloroflexota bacterium]
MQHQRLHQITEQFNSKRVVVCGDFFLDRYLWIDQQRAEISVETGKVAHQVTSQSTAPGAAGTVAANLAALGANVICLGVIGDDGDGYMLRNGLLRIGADDNLLVVTPDRPTATYTKPTVRHVDGNITELERLDIRSRVPLDESIISQIAHHLDTLADTVDAVIFADQMPESGCGVIGKPIHDVIAQLAKTHPTLPIFADSRQRISEFRHVIIKPNIHEACQACMLPQSLEHAYTAAQTLSYRTQKPVVTTLGSEGVLIYEHATYHHVPAIPVDQPIDVVGAGDSVMAALAISAASGASLVESASIAMMVAGVTVRKIGTTGTATINEVVAIASQYGLIDE